MFASMKRTLFALVIVFSTNLVAQDSHRFKVELGSGMEMGQWSINLGYWAPNISPAELFYKTPKEFSIPISISAAINMKRIDFGVEVKHNWFLVSEMFCSGNSSDSPCTGLISEGDYVNLAAFTIFCNYDVVYKKVYRFGPRIHFGTFIENSTSPVEKPSGPYVHYRFDLRNELHLKNLYFSVSPSFSKYRIGSNSENSRKGSHKIYHTGLLFGCGINF